MVVRKREASRYDPERGGLVWVDWCPHSYIEVELGSGEIVDRAIFDLNLSGASDIVALRLPVAPNAPR